MKFCTYILYSQKLDAYYTGESEDLNRRIAEHNAGVFKGSFTASANDWTLFLRAEFESRPKARKFEQFIKKLKSRKFMESLKDDPQKFRHLIEKFS